MKRIAVLASGLAVVALLAFTMPALAQGPAGSNGWGGHGMFGGRGGMMGGYGYGPSFAPSQVITPTAPFGRMGGYGYGFGPTGTITSTYPYGFGPGGMMRYGFGFGPTGTITSTLPYGYGPGGMMRYGFGFGPTGTFTSTLPYGYGRRGMMGFGYGSAPTGTPITIDQAVSKAQSYVASIDNADLKLVELEEYAWNFYGVVQEKSTGIDAFQVLVDKYSGAVYPEMGPNMMWNSKYSPMGARWSGGTNTGSMTVTMDQARANATQFLKTYLPNTTVEDKGDTFYGYYNFDVLLNGKTYGMLSVNGYSGAVWYHTWHGAYVGGKDLG